MNSQEIKKITVIGGNGRNGETESVKEVNLKMGDIISIVGPTGSGKTALINDIALFANTNTPSKRRILINDEVPSEEFVDDPSKNPIALITQHTNFLSDMHVKEFLEMHIAIRNTGEKGKLVKETLDFANQLTGEPIIIENSMTELSGGQTRALLIADAVIIGNSPIILLDEIENAGIHRIKALEILKRYKKILVFVTHDPRIALLSDFRIIMKNGAMKKLIVTCEEEKVMAEVIKKFDDLMMRVRDILRSGEIFSRKELEEEGLKLLRSL